jgi:hypothetical protein
MQDKEAELLVRNLIEVFDERDATKRLGVVQELYTENAIFYEPDASFQGYEAINNRVSELLSTLPSNANFAPIAKPNRNHHLARLSWTLATEEGPVMVRGMDVAVVEDGRIATLYLFIDPPPAG